MKHIMNDVQTVKSIDAYQNMTNVQKERFRKESGLLIAYIFVPWLLLIPCYFVLSKSHFEDAICTAGVLSVVGLFYGLYKVAKQREFDGEGDMIIYVLRFFFVVYGFGILWQVHWLLGIAFAAAVVWYISLRKSIIMRRTRKRYRECSLDANMKNQVWSMLWSYQFLR